MQAASSSSSSIISASPSLNSYSASNNTLADVAARVAHELRFEDCPLPFDWYEEDLDQQPLPTNYYYQHEDEVEDEEFEFSFMCGNPESTSLVPADEIFHNGQIKPTYSSVFSSEKPTRRPQLRVLMGFDSSCSSSDADELDRIAPGTYCVWKPTACKKSSSTGSSRRWKLSQLLLNRSNSDGAKAVVETVRKAEGRWDPMMVGKKWRRVT